MRILIYSDGPHVYSGYGVQCRLLIRQLRLLGCDVAVSDLQGVPGSVITWDGVPVFPAGQAPGAGVLLGHARFWEPGLVITLMDFGRLLPAAAAFPSQKFTLAAWLPVDTSDRLGRPDLDALRLSGAKPVAMSQHGLKLLRQAGFTGAACIPLSADLAVFRPPEDVRVLREQAGTAGRFVIGLCAANTDGARKGFPEQLQAFAAFRATHPGAMLCLHTLMRTAEGLNLYEMVEDFGLADCTLVTDQDAATAGLVPPAAMAAWYQSLDVLTSCSYGEGFGLPVLEAQACGTPVVVTRASAMTELCGAGWMVSGEDFWNPVHRAKWVRPRIRQITAAYGRAFQRARGMREQAAAFALPYEWERVARDYWKPFLESIAP